MATVRRPATPAIDELAATSARNPDYKGWDLSVDLRAGLSDIVLLDARSRDASFGCAWYVYRRKDRPSLPPRLRSDRVDGDVSLCVPIGYRYDPGKGGSSLPYGLIRLWECFISKSRMYLAMERLGLFGTRAMLYRTNGLREEPDTKTEFVAQLAETINKVERCCAALGLEASSRAATTALRSISDEMT